jgi:4'-phosphopantetheinyl transferase
MITVGAGRSGSSCPVPRPASSMRSPNVSHAATLLEVHHAVHVYAAPVAAMQPERVDHVLDLAEVARLASFQSEAARRRFIGGRVLLRTMLAEFVGAAPQTLHFDHDPWGKPRLASSPGDCPRFSLTHGGELALVAISATVEVGVDIERIRPVPEALGIARRIFDPASRAAVHETAPECRDATFLRHWTRLEALAKGAGCGLARLLEQTQEPGGAGRIVVRSGDQRARQERRFESYDLPLGSDYVGTLVVECRSDVAATEDSGTDWKA